MIRTILADRLKVAGLYDLVGVNGSLLPARVEDGSDEKGEQIECCIVAGAIRLDPDGTYGREITARFDAPSQASWTRVLASQGSWRFLPSALDDSSGEVLLTPANGPPTSAAVTDLSLVYRTRVPGALVQAMECNWVYVRRSR
jgi:hypothetical protein